MLPRYGVEVSTVPGATTKRWKTQSSSSTCVLVSESPTNPYNRILDLGRFAAIGRKHRVKTIIDATFATPYNARPLEWGVDLVMHSATKYLGGHNDLLACAVLGSRDLVGGIRALPATTGATVDPFAAYLLVRGLKTFALRMERRTPTRRRRRNSSPPTHECRRPLRGTAEPSWPRRREEAERRPGDVVPFEVQGDLDTASPVVDACTLPYMARRSAAWKASSSSPQS